jgi:hypothetical protein
MAYPGESTFPGATTFPGVTIPPGVVTEHDVGDLYAAPQGVPPRDALLVKLTPPGGRGGSVVRECPSDLVFDSTAPGGHGGMSCTIDWVDGQPPPDALAIAATAEVIDRRNGGTIWYGHVVDPGYTRTGTGAAHKISCLGFYTVLDTEARVLAYIDRDLGAWLNVNDYPAGTGQIVDDLSLGTHPQDWVDPTTSVIEQTYPQGSSLDASTPSHMTMQYLPSKYTSGPDIVMLLASVQGRADANFRIHIRVRNAANNANDVYVVDYDDLSPNAVDFYIAEGTGAWTTINARWAELRFEYSGSSDATASRDWWLRWGNLAVAFQRVDRNGDNAESRTPYLHVWQIVDDVIGRMLRTQLDISAAIAQPDVLVEQAAWWGGITARGVFDFIEDLYPQAYWAVWEPQADTKPRFEYLPWRTHPRYIIPPGSASIALAGGGDELFNRAVVAYQTSKGVPASVTVVGFVQELDAADVDRTMVLDVTGEGPLSKKAASARGLDALASQDILRSSGTATVFGPVYDVKSGRMIEPWEIRAGWPVVLGGGVLRADGGSAYSLTGSRDGRSTFRLTQVQYTVSSASAELTLDGGGRNLFNRVRRPIPRQRRSAVVAAREAAGGAKRRG